MFDALVLPWLNRFCLTLFWPRGDYAFWFDRHSSLFLLHAVDYASAM